MSFCGPVVHQNQWLGGFVAAHSIQLPLESNATTRISAKFFSPEIPAREILAVIAVPYNSFAICFALYYSQEEMKIKSIQITAVNIYNIDN